VRFPLLKANPTKLVPALHTSHVVATATFLDRGFAFRTILRMLREPVSGFTVHGRFWGRIFDVFLFRVLF